MACEELYLMRFRQ